MIARPMVLQRFAAALLCAGLLAPPAPAAELKKKSLETFDRYIRLTEARIDAEIQKSDPFLWVDSLPAPKHMRAYEHLRSGDVVIEKLKTLDNGQPIQDDDSLIHHWIGTVFVPGISLAEAIALAQQYDRHAEIYKPDVMESRILSRDGNDFKVFFRFYKHKAIVTTVHNTEHDVRYLPIDAHRLQTRTRTTRIAEVKDHDKPDGPEKPVGNDSGYLWRMNTYWRYLEKDGGTYIQCESVSLTRDIPFLLDLIIRPFVEGVPRESLAFTLSTTRSALIARHSTTAKKSSEQ
ncbi:MAG: hypothetical protein HY234_12130 [Acidobacteria bacterium]|nr:hypothetical protein [Acidobacteriota bacterium]